jgi:hypothetical protein
MQVKYRTLLEFVVFGGLCVAIVLAAKFQFQPPSYRFGFDAVALSLGLGLFILLLGYAVRQCSVIAADRSLLSGALWELVRLMEGNSPAASSGRAAGRKELLHHFAVDGAHKVAAGRPMPMGDTAGLDLTKLAFELMDRNDKDGSAQSRKIASIRRGVFVFYAIVGLRKSEIAYRAMVEHMKFQVRLGEDSGIDNFSELKELLGLPVPWPADAARIADCERRGLAPGRSRAIAAALRKGEPQIFDGVEYMPGQGEPGVAFAGARAILTQMRAYIR